MQTGPLGTTGPRISAIGLSCRALGVGVAAYGALARGLLGTLDLDLGPADLAPIEAAVQMAHLDREAPQA
jgi:hypothetical protein